MKFLGLSFLVLVAASQAFASETIRLGGASQSREIVLMHGPNPVEGVLHEFSSIVPVLDHPLEFNIKRLAISRNGREFIAGDVVIVNGDRPAVFHINPQAHSMRLFQVSQLKAGDKSYPVGSSRHAQVNVSQERLKAFIENIGIVRSANQLFDGIVRQYSVSLPPDFPHRSDVMSEKHVGNAAHFVPIVMDGQRIEFDRYIQADRHINKSNVTLTLPYAIQASPVTWRQLLAVFPEMMDEFNKIGAGLIDSSAHVTYVVANAFAAAVVEITREAYWLVRQAQWEGASLGRHVRYDAPHPHAYAHLDSGIYDGNLEGISHLYRLPLEWVQDIYEENPSSQFSVDPTGPRKGPYRAGFGIDLLAPKGMPTNIIRGPYYPDTDMLAFRLARPHP